MSTILVTGGTGSLGSLVAGRLRAAGHEVRVLSRRSPEHPVDLLTGAGLDAAVEGADTVVHCASDPRGGDERAAAHLIAAARRAGVGHLAYISIVGVDVVPLRYYRAKLAVEEMLTRSVPGVTILRTTQFHDLVARALGTMAKLPVMPLPAGVSGQPIAVEEVADRLVELAVAGPAGRVPDMGGPQVLTFEEAARAYLAATGGRRRLLLPVPLAGRAYAGFKRGGHLAPEHAVGKGTFAEFLAARAAG
ncbi:SDR family oxidoreductase [Streptomyces sp. NPDC059917]|uniref:SDR family oxidoreductase n=1 Tax=Streptomyces sp. NPDC059917 TaxID=3347002 RepID=UPI003648683A